MSIRFTFLPGLILITLIIVFTRLGFWQLDREQQKIRIIQSFQTAAYLPWALVQDDTPRYTRVSGSGRLLQHQSILLDNQIHQGRAGVHVYTPFRFDDGRLALVNRGWLPMAADRIPPQVPRRAETAINLSGILNLPPKVGRQLGQARPLNPRSWPNLVTYLELPLVAAALGESVSPWVIQLDADHAAGFSGRDWRPVNFGPKKHRAYAIQWFALAATVLIVLIILAIRGISANARRRNEN